jgi:ABC-type amino acid transport substrate-binding protein
VSSSASGTRIAAVVIIDGRQGMCRGLLFSLGLGCLWLAGPAPAQKSLLDTVLKRDKLIVATYSTSPPLAYVDDAGKLVGFEIDMAHEIAQRSAGRS